MHTKKRGLILFSLVITFTLVSIPVEGASAHWGRYRRRDKIPPEVTITNPVMDEIISGVVPVSFKAVDNFRLILGWEVYIDGELRLSLKGFRAWLRWNRAPKYKWDTTLETEGMHTITCKARDLRGNWGFDVISIIINNHAPSQITGLNATTIDMAGISLEWNENSDADFSHYRVYRDGEVLTQLYYPYLDDIGLFPETTYTYEVSAIDISGNEGLKSAPASATTNPGEANGEPIADSIVLNEFLPHPINLFTEEWIELYNPHSQDVDISGYILDDIIGAGTIPYKIPSGTIIPANGFFVFYQNVTNIGLNYAGDTLNYIHPNGTTVLDSYTYGSSSDDVSYGRETDGGTPWVAFDQPTPGTTNAPASSFTYPFTINVIIIDPNTIYFEEWVERSNPFSDKLVRPDS
ncbi:MAG: lamin tail domain-containing protein [Candidatus Hodarchaeales archaeon]|jgi:hypothetical protein